MLKHIEEFGTKPVVDRVFDLDEAQQAFDYIEESNQFGKVALRVTN